MQIAEQAEKEGVWDLRRSALQKVKDGVTSLEEINRVTIESLIWRCGRVRRAGRARADVIDRACGAPTVNIGVADHG